MAMHRLPAGTEGPRWRVLAAVWATSALPAAASAFAARPLFGWAAALGCAAFLWLAVQWALWLYVKDRPPAYRADLKETWLDGPTIRMAAVEANPPAARLGLGDLGTGPDLDRHPGPRHALTEPTAKPPIDPEEYHQMELEELQFTDEEIDHAVHALSEAQTEQEGVSSATAEHVRAVLRAVRAVPARCLNGGLAGLPAAVGSTVAGTGLGGVQARGWVVWSYPVTTCLRDQSGEEIFVWTNTLRSWDPSTAEIVLGNLHEPEKKEQP